MFSGLLATLFQPNKGHLSPAGRAFISWLEVLILGLIIAGASVGIDYLNGHPNDYKGALNIIIYTVVLSLLKALSTLSIPRVTPQTPLPVAQQLPALATPPQQTVLDAQGQVPPSQGASPAPGTVPQLEFSALPLQQQQGQPLIPMPGMQQQAGSTYPWIPAMPQPPKG